MQRIAMQRRSVIAAAIMTTFSVGVLTGCGNSGSTVAAKTTSGATPVSVTSTVSTTAAKPASSSSTAAPAVTAVAAGPLAGRTKPTVEPKSGTAPTALVARDLIVGAGAEAVVGALVDVHYVGVLYDGGTEFDASWGRGSVFSFSLGASQVIKGWDQGVAGMKAGGRRELVIPADLAYGATAKGKIPANSTLVFVVDLARVNAEPVIVADATPAPDLTQTDLLVGTGTEAKLGDTVSINFVLVSATTGKKLFSSWQTAKPTTVTLGDGRAIKGWDQGIVGMKTGGRRRLSVPPALAYGAAGNAQIGPNETLLYVVELVSVTPA